MATDRSASQQSEDDMLPDEREVIAERASDLDELEEDEYLTTDDLAESLDIDLD